MAKRTKKGRRKTIARGSCQVIQGKVRVCHGLDGKIRISLPSGKKARRSRGR